MRKLFRLEGREPGPEHDVRTELEAHLAMKVDALIASGLSPEAAREEATRQFGSMSGFERRTRAEADLHRRRRQWGDRSGAWLMDLRLAVRGLLRAPGFTVLATIILALGIGATVAVLAVANRLLLTPLPFRDSDRLFMMVETSRGGAARLPSYPTVEDWRRQATGFAGIAYVPGNTVLWRSPTGAELVVVAYPSAEFFPVVSGIPVLGRTLTPSDEASGDRVAVLTYRFWQRRFGGDPKVVGTSLSLAEGAVTIVGVMPNGFELPSWADLYVPMNAMNSSLRETIALRGNHADALVVGRIGSGTSREAAIAELTVVAGRLAEQYPAEQADWTSANLVPIRDFVYNPAVYSGRGLSDPVRTVMVFSAAVALVLLIACANVAGLTLVRGQARSREVAIRAALGAGRWQLIRQRLLESALIAAAGGVLGTGLAAALLGAVKRMSPDLLPRLGEVGLDAKLVLGAIGIAALAALLSGLLPALKATPTALAELVKTGARGGGSRAQNRVQRGLVAVQLSLAVTLLIGATVLLRSFTRVMNASVGFEPSGVMTVAINPDRVRYPTGESTLTLYRDLVAAIGRVPGVQSVALTNHLPISGASYPTRLDVEGHVSQKDAAPPTAIFRVVSPEYFDTMRIPIRRGTGFTEADLAAPNDRLVVNESLARRYWPGQDPLGKRITVYTSARWLADFGQPISGVVVAVIGDVLHFGAESTPVDEVYVPYTWNAWAWTAMVVRTDRDPELLADPLAKAMASVDPDLPLMTGSKRNIASYASMMTASRGPRRLMTMIAAGVAGAALLLAIVGLYGVMAYFVNLRAREIGIRGALGATRAEILGLVMRQGLRLAGVGTAIGLVGGWIAAASMRSIVFGVSVRDFAAFAVVPAVLLAVAAVAILVPARRASRLDPVTVLKGE